jgi:hypothetical protein
MVMIGRVEQALQCRIGADENAIVSAMFVGSLRRPMQPRPDPQRRLILAPVEHAPSRLKLGAVEGFRSEAAFRLHFGLALAPSACRGSRVVLYTRNRVNLDQG